MIKHIPKHKRIYVDETGVDTVLYRRFAWAFRGKKIHQKITGKPFLRTSIIAGLRNNDLMATMEYRGYCNTEVILSWVEQVLVPELEVGDVVIWDNASFHKSPKIKALIEEAGCELLFLPPYSPDLNPIEGWWAVLKWHLTTLVQEGMFLHEAIAQYFQTTLANVG
jgi:transposase